MRILVVEDEPLVRSLTVEALLEAGFEVVEADTGEQALERCRDDMADVLVTDIRLPGRISGWDVAEHCREQNPALPVIYATGFSHVPARPVPGSRIFHKPYRPADLVHTIRSLTAAA